MALALSQPKTLDNNSLLSSMLNNPIEFGKPIHRSNNSNIHHKMTIVHPGPPSPPPTKKNLVNGNSLGKVNGRRVEEEKEEEDDLESIDDDEEDDLASRNGDEDQINQNIITTKSHSLPNGNVNRGAIQLPTPNTTQPSSLTSSASSVQSPNKKPTAQTPKPSTSTSTSYQPKINPDDIYQKQINLNWPEPIASIKRPAAGLHNPSMACYANATLQVLLHTPPVLRICMEHDESQCPRATKHLFCMLCQLRDMATGSHWSKRNSYAPAVHSQLKFIKKGFSKNRQEDTHEFFRFVTDALQATALHGTPKDLPEKIKHSSWVYKVWGGKVRSRVICSRCNKPSDTFDWFLDLALDVNRSGSKSIKNMMNGFTREDKLEGDNKYHCDNCKAKANATKSFKIEEAPPVLTLHLKRFSVDYNSYSGRARANKYNGPIDFSEYLDIAPYMVDPKDPGTKYRLFGVTCHRGVELRFGHYTSYVKGPQGQWFHADDDDMSPVKLANVLNDKTAYLLSYIRISDDTMPTPPSSVTKRVNGLVNGHAPSPLTPKVGDKRQRSDEGSDEEDEEEQNVNVLKAKKNGNSNGPIRPSPSGPMMIRKATPPLSKFKSISTPSPSQPKYQHQDEEGDVNADLPPELPTRQFGSYMSLNPKHVKSKQPSTPPPNRNGNGILNPKPIAPGQFYGKSPIQRPSNPRPDHQDRDDPITTFSSSESSRNRDKSLSKKEKKQLSKKMKRMKMKGTLGSSPYGSSQLSRTDRSTAKDRSKFGKMKGKPQK